MVKENTNDTTNYRDYTTGMNPPASGLLIIKMNTPMMQRKYDF